MTRQEADKTPKSDRAGPRRTQRNARKTLGAMIIALGVLAVLNADALERYVGNFGSMTVVEVALVKIQDWRRLLQIHHLDKPRTVIRERVESFREKRFGEPE